MRSKFWSPFIFSLALILVRGYEFGVRNQLAFLPMIEKRTGLLAFSDFNLDTHRFYHLNFSFLAAFFGKIPGLPLVFLLGYFFTAFLFYLGIDKISRALFGDPKPGMLSACLLLLWGSLGLERNNFWYTSTFEPYFLAYALGLLSAGLFLEERKKAAALVSALCFAVHFQMGLILAVVWLASELLEGAGKKPSGFIKIFLLYAALFAPVVLEHTPVLFKIKHADPAFTIAYQRFRMPHHFLWDPGSFLIFSLVILAGILAFIFFSKKFPGAYLKKHRQALGLNLILFSLCLLQYADFYFLKTGFFSGIQFLRMSPVIHFFGLLYLSALLLRFAESRSLALNWAAVLLCFGLGPAALSSGFEYQKYLLAVLLPCLAVVAVFRKKASILFVLLLVLLGFQAYLGISLKKTQFVYDARNDLSDPWIELCRWTRDHTEKEALFITPPYTEGFMFYAQRRMVAEFGVNPHLPDEIAEWRSRLADLSGGVSLNDCGGFDCYPALRNGYGRLSGEQVKEIARKHDAHYFVTDGQTGYEFPLVYRNEKYSLYEVR